MIEKNKGFIEILCNFEKTLGFKSELKWRNVILIPTFHIAAVYFAANYAFPVKWQTVISVIFMFILGGSGIISGAHRLWTHRTFKAKFPLKLILAIGFSSAGQNSIYEWVRDHRLHHKFSDTEADPHDSTRGLFFSHIGWLMMKKSKAVQEKGRKIDMSDIESDKLLMFEHRHSTILSMLFCFILPTLACTTLWGETLACAVAWQCFIRVLWVLHTEMTVNSLAHAFGYKPYNKHIASAQNILVAVLSGGEGWHNYHHVFPYDYKAADVNDPFNLSAKLIRLFAKIGWAYDLREPSRELVESVQNRLNQSLDGMDDECHSY